MLRTSARECKREGTRDFLGMYSEHAHRLFTSHVRGEQAAWKKQCKPTVALGRQGVCKGAYEHFALLER